MLALFLLSVCVAMIVLFVLDTIETVTNTPTHSGWLLVNVSVVGLFAGTFVLNRRGHVRLAGYITIFLLVLVPTLLLPFDTMNDSLIVYALPITLASFLLFPAAAVLVCLLAFSAYALANAVGLTGSVFNFLGIFGLLVLALMCWLVADWLQRTLQHAQTAEAELRAEIADRQYTEEQLARLNQELEQRVLERTGALAAVNVDLKREIADREQVERALRESEERLRAVANASPVPLLISRLSDTTVLEANTPVADLFGVTRPALIGQLARGYFVDQREFRQLVVQVHRQGHVRNAELRVRKADGTLFWVAASSHPLTFGGEPALVTGFYDLSERRQAEEALRDSEERFRQIAENIREVFWVSQPDTGQILYVSPAYEETWGRTRESLYADPRSWTTAVHPDDRTRMDEYLVQQRRGEAAFAEYRIVRPDGSIGWIWDRAFPVRDESGQVARFVGVAEDISERRHAEEELRRALAQEQELNDLKSRFISMTSHEFRTPLSGILSAAELLEHYGHRWPDDKRLRYLQQIQTGVKNLTALLDDVLVIGRAEAQRLAYDPAALDLDRFCRDLVEEVQLSAKYHTLALNVRWDDSPAHLDAKLLHHILVNLLSNAIKYSPQGGQIELEVAPQDTTAVFRITDHGIGIPPADRDRLYETFHRAGNVGNIPGTGLGLAIVKRSVDLHGGTIVYTSELGRGTTFVVSLPYRSLGSEDRPDAG